MKTVLEETTAAWNAKRDQLATLKAELGRLGEATRDANVCRDEIVRLRHQRDEICANALITQTAADTAAVDEAIKGQQQEIQSIEGAEVIATRAKEIVNERIEVAKAELVELNDALHRAGVDHLWNEFRQTEKAYDKALKPICAALGRMAAIRVAHRQLFEGLENEKYWKAEKLLQAVDLYFRNVQLVEMRAEQRPNGSDVEEGSTSVPLMLQAVMEHQTVPLNTLRDGLHAIGIPDDGKVWRDPAKFIRPAPTQSVEASFNPGAHQIPEGAFRPFANTGRLY